MEIQSKHTKVVFWEVIGLNVNVPPLFVYKGSKSSVKSFMINGEPNEGDAYLLVESYDVQVSPSLIINGINFASAVPVHSKEKIWQTSLRPISKLKKGNNTIQFIGQEFGSVSIGTVIVHWNELVGLHIPGG
jgi:hypothetical protein